MQWEDCLQGWRDWETEGGRDSWYRTDTTNNRMTPWFPSRVKSQNRIISHHGVNSRLTPNAEHWWIWG